jgi:heme/copper-type cytochrome/quinol oxidase subunit 2
MKEILFSIVIFMILWLLLFLCSVLYLNKFEVLIKIIRLDFEEVNKIEIWISLILSLVISAVLLYSLS